MTNTQQVLAALRANSEDRYALPGTWTLVYLDNARPKDMSDKVFRANLGQLAKQKLYRVVDGYAWGEVKVATPSTVAPVCADDDGGIDYAL